jgi:hypothetical protein
VGGRPHLKSEMWAARLGWWGCGAPGQLFEGLLSAVADVDDIQGFCGVVNFIEDSVEVGLVAVDEVTHEGVFVGYGAGSWRVGEGTDCCLQSEKPGEGRV